MCLWYIIGAIVFFASLLVAKNMRKNKKNLPRLPIIGNLHQLGPSLSFEIDYKGLNFELLPFGSGRRMCPGMGMDMALAHLTLINLLYRFDWKLLEGMGIEDVDLEEAYGLVCPKKAPLQVIPVLTQWS